MAGPRLPKVAIVLGISALILAYDKAANLLYVQPFGLDAASLPHRNIFGEDDRAPR